MPPRRILCLWFPRLAAERVLRAEPGLAGQPLAVVADARGALVLASLDAVAEAAGLRRGMALGDARAICPALVTRPQDPCREAAFLAALRRWAGGFSPGPRRRGPRGWCSTSPAARISSAARQRLLARIEAEAAGFGLSLGLGLADTLGAAWAVARYTGAGSWPAHAGDAIDQEARATRSRAGKRSWTGQARPAAAVSASARVVPPGTLARVGPLPVAALGWSRPRSRRWARWGSGGSSISSRCRGRSRPAGGAGGAHAARPGARAGGRAGGGGPSAAGLRGAADPARADRARGGRAGGDRPAAAAPLRPARGGRAGGAAGAADASRTDGRAERREVGLARPACRPEAIRPLLALRLGEIDAGFGIERLRLEAVAVEPLAAGKQAEARGFADLLGRLGARLGSEAMVRLHPADSHIPEKGASEMAAAFSAPAAHWPPPAAPRPILIFPPEPIAPEDAGIPRRPWSGAGGDGGAPPPSGRSGSRPSGGSTTRPGGRGRAATGGWRPRRGSGSGSSRRRGARCRGGGSRKGSSHDAGKRKAPENRGWRAPPGGGKAQLALGPRSTRIASRTCRHCSAGLAVALGGVVLGLLGGLVLRPVAVRRVRAGGRSRRSGRCSWMFSFGLSPTIAWQAGLGTLGGVSRGAAKGSLCRRRVCSPAGGGWPGRRGCVACGYLLKSLRYNDNQLRNLLNFSDCLRCRAPPFGGSGARRCAQSHKWAQACSPAPAGRSPPPHTPALLSRFLAGRRKRIAWPVRCAMPEVRGSAAGACRSKRRAAKRGAEAAPWPSPSSASPRTSPS